VWRFRFRGEIRSLLEIHQCLIIVVISICENFTCKWLSATADYILRRLINTWNLQTMYLCFISYLYINNPKSGSFCFSHPVDSNGSTLLNGLFPSNPLWVPFGNSWRIYKNVSGLTHFNMRPQTVFLAILGFPFWYHVRFSLDVKCASTFRTFHLLCCMNTRIPIYSQFYRKDLLLYCPLPY